MKQLRFGGHSDDRFGYMLPDNCGDDHDDCGNSSMMAFTLTSGDEGLIVTGQYAPEPVTDGTWVVGVTLLAEDKPLPNWPMRWQTADNGYSPELVIEAPDDVKIEDITRKEDGDE